MEAQLGAKNQKKISNGQDCRTGTHVRTKGRTHDSEFIGSFRSLKTSGEPKIHAHNMHLNGADPTFLDHLIENSL